MGYLNSNRNRYRNKYDSSLLQYLNPSLTNVRTSNVHGIASDYWSLGVLAFELLFGQRPFEKHCPSLHIAYLEEALKRTATKSALKKELQRVRGGACVCCVLLNMSAQCRMSDRDASVLLLAGRV